MKRAPKLQPVVAILALDGAVGLYAESLRFLTWKFRHSDYQVVGYGCDRALKACTSFNSINKEMLESKHRAAVCDRCVGSQAKLHADKAFFISECDHKELRKAELFLGDLIKILNATKRTSDVLDMQYSGFPVCRNAFFDFSITTKLSRESVLDSFAINRFIAGVEDQIKLLSAFERFHKSHTVTHLVYVNGNYSQNTLARQFFTRFGVTCLSVEPQLTSQSILNRIMIAKDRLPLEPEGLYPRMSISEGAESFSVLDGAKTLENFGARISGRDFNAYTNLRRRSISKEEFARLEGFLRSHPRIHSFFPSSEDELTPHIYSHKALKGDPGGLGSIGPFSNQAEFIIYLLSEAARYPEIGFVVRMHPRMAANKRDQFESEEHIRYKKILSGRKLPDNVLIVYGDSAISSYYLIFKSDLVVIGWSTIGIEALLLGTPVISLFPSCLMYPLSSFSRQPATWPELETALFKKSGYGVPQDVTLLSWITRAFETQFFATAAPRGRGGVFGIVYRVFYRILSRIGMYDVVALAVNFLLLRNVRSDDGRLLVKPTVRRPFMRLRIYFLNRGLSRYRCKLRNALADYGA